MQTMFWVNKLGKSLVLFLLGLWVIGPVYANVDTPWVKSKGGQVHLQMADGTVYALTLNADVEGVFYDRDKHPVKGDNYISLFQASPSNRANPTGLCGAGNEIWLYVYQVTGAELVEKTKSLVSSCLHSISMTSQNSGASGQDRDFSSVQWNSRGFSIEWFDHVDAAGRSLKLSNFMVQDGDFVQQDVLIQNNPKN